MTASTTTLKTSISKDSTKCELCNDTGFVEVENDLGVFIVRKCECYERKIQESKVANANIPKEFKDNTLKNFRTDIYGDEKSNTAIKMACAEVGYFLNHIDDEDCVYGLYLYSNTKGSGKTRMASSIGNEFLEKRKVVKFMTSQQIIQEIKNSMFDKSDNCLSEKKLIKSFSEFDVLIIDDFGVEKTTDFVNDKIYEIVNNRYMSKRTTIFTSNEHIDTIDYDERITSRIKQMTYQIQFPEISIREIKQKEQHEKMRKEIYG